MKQWKSGKLNLQGKGYACISPDGSNELTWLPLQKIRPKGGPSLQNGDRSTKTPGGRNSNTGHWQHSPYDLPTWGKIKTLTNQTKNLVSQQEMPRSPKNISWLVQPLL